ncbi:hypothetical protein GLOIN_2v1778530 [Rhizophagus clarus]|uniref:Uncharacterized protein n=1 Tax=Rhizophagus clarus TaxID=94130 RepID=A0A8H3QK00_9GLOM|nr:hypothetical protein GLOIN_2v1778530 [Rhizophagus clarus]
MMLPISIIQLANQVLQKTDLIIDEFTIGFKVYLERWLWRITDIYRIYSDGNNVGRKIKHVMITCTILNDIINIHKVPKGLKDSSGVKLYFSSDWKFLAIILVLMLQMPIISVPGVKERYYIRNKDKIYKVKKNMD